MNSLKRFGLIGCALAVIVPLFGGCSTEDSKEATLGQGVVLTEEPTGATTIAVATDTIDKNPNVSIVASVVEDETEAFVKGQAAFVIAEVGSGGGCSEVDCPFCEDCKGKKSKKAAVQFVGDSGEPLAVDARELLDIQPGDTVVIQGKGEVLPGLEMLKVTAEHIFVRPRTEKSE